VGVKERRQPKPPRSDKADFNMEHTLRSVSPAASLVVPA
jgi:hypothetical protein